MVLTLAPSRRAELLAIAQKGDQKDVAELVGDLAQGDVDMEELVDVEEVRGGGPARSKQSLGSSCPCCRC